MICLKSCSTPWSRDSHGEHRTRKVWL